MLLALCVSSYTPSLAWSAAFNSCFSLFPSTLVSTSLRIASFITSSWESSSSYLDQLELGFSRNSAWALRMEDILLLTLDAVTYTTRVREMAGLRQENNK